MPRLNNNVSVYYYYINRNDMAAHPFWGADAGEPPSHLPQQAVYDNLVRSAILYVV